MTDAFNYITSRATADRLITKFGAAAFVRRVTNSGSDFDPIQTTADFPTFATKIEFTWKQMQGGNVLENDERWLVAAGPLDAFGILSVLPGDALVVGSVVKSVLDSKPLAPAGVTVLFDCHIRG